MELYYFVDWNRIKARTWSGTCWGLYQALQRHFNVVDMDMKESIFHKIWKKMKCQKPDMDYHHILNRRKHYLPVLEKESHPVSVFQFKEYIPTIGHIKSYIYQDLTVSYVKYMKQNLPNVFQVSGYEQLDDEVIERKLVLEQENQKTCSAMFCMGEWLRNDCINRLGISPDRVFAVGGV